LSLEDVGAPAEGVAGAPEDLRTPQRTGREEPEDFRRANIGRSHREPPPRPRPVGSPGMNPDGGDRHLDQTLRTKPIGFREIVKGCFEDVLE
jgi:hypothetical protein